MPSWAHDALIELSDQLLDRSEPLTQELYPCGEAIITDFRQTIVQLHAVSDWQQACDRLDAMIQDAHANMSRIYRLAESTLCWRRLYTDACIMRSLAEFTFVGDEPSDAMVHRCVASLDQAIIIAGPCGEGRLEFIQLLISKFQEKTSSKENIKLSLVFPPSPSVSLPLSFTQPIPRFDVSPSLASFLRLCTEGPFILPGFINDWPALGEHPWNSLRYLKQASGPGRLVPLEVGGDYRNEDWGQELASWDDFLDYLVSPERQNQVRYLAQHNLFAQFPALRDDVRVPDYVYVSPPSPGNYSSYRPPGNEEQLVMNVWLGPKGTVSPAHTDPFYNFYAQVVGRKTVWLAPPEVSQYMDSAKCDDHSHNPAANTTSPSLSNTSQIDVFSSSHGPERAAFTDHVVPRATYATLEPGDLLFFPPGWWHAMRSEDTSFSVSMWF